MSWVLSSIMDELHVGGGGGVIFLGTGFPCSHNAVSLVSGSSLGLLLSLLLGGLGLFMLVLAGAFLLVLLLGAGYRDTQVAGEDLMVYFI